MMTMMNKKGRNDVDTEDTEWRCVCLCRVSALREIPEIVSLVEKLMSVRLQDREKVLEWFVKECVYDPLAKVYPRSKLFNRCAFVACHLYEKQ